MRDEIDRAIDDVARELTAGDTGRDFRVRVLARIDAGERVERRWPAAWVVSPLAVAAAIVVFFFIVRGYQPRSRSPEAPGQQAFAKVRPTDSARATSVEKPNTTEMELKPERTETGRQTARSSARRASEIDALAPPPLNVPSIALAPIDRGGSLQLPQLDPIAPIDVAPLAVEQPNHEP